MQESLLKIGQIVFADIILSGDNALVIGMAAAGVAPEYRRRAIAFGLAMAAILRILFAALATLLLQVPGILFVGGLLLSWVCWRFYKDIRSFGAKVHAPAAGGSDVPMRNAMTTIIVADISMSIDNVLAVAAIARHDTALLVFGLVLAIALMALCATFIMRIMTRFPALSYAGLAFLVYLSAKMLHDGWPDVIKLMAPLAGIA